MLENHTESFFLMIPRPPRLIPASHFGPEADEPEDDEEGDGEQEEDPEAEEEPGVVDEVG